MIEVKGLRFTYPSGGEVLTGIDLDFPPGGYIGVVGSNGSGKSTLMKHLNALLLPSAGEVRIDGVATGDDPDRARHRVGMVLQNPENQIVGSVVEDDVAFGPENHRLDPGEIRERVTEALERVGLGECLGRAAETLSGGQKQRLAIAGILALRPAYVVLDEPTSMLDPRGREEVRACLRDLRDRHGIGVLHVTHLLEELTDADRIVGLKKGRIVFDGTPAAFLRDRKMLTALELELPAPVAIALALEAKGILGAPAPLEPGKVLDALAPGIAQEAGTAGSEPSAGSLAGAGTDRPPATPGGAGGGLPAGTGTGAAVLVEALDLDVEYGSGGPLSVTALQAISLALRDRELLGLVGATGSGKSTLVQVLAGLVPATRGKIAYADSIDSRSLYRSLGMVFQQPEDQLFEPTVREDVGYGPRQLELDPAEVQARVEESLGLMGLRAAEVLDRSPFELSGGEKRRVAIAGILAMRPRILVFDEPTAGLDARARSLLAKRLAELHETSTATVVVVSHDMDLLAELATRLVVLDHGRLVVEGSPAEVFSQVDRLSRSGLRPPFSVLLLDRLRRRGLDVPVLPMTPEDVVAALDSVRSSLPGGSP